MSSDSPSLESIFASAIQKSSKERMLNYVDSIAGASEEVKTQARQLIEAHCKSAKSFLEAPATGVNSKLEQLAQTMDVQPQSMEAGLTAAFSEDAAVVVGGTGHSVLKSLSKQVGKSLNVTLKDDSKGHSGQHTQHSSDIPNSDADSRYQLHGEIARGGMGAVLKGRDVDLGRDLAVKVLLDKHRDKPELLERFVEEAQIGGQLQHPGIVPVYELGQFEDQRPFFTMKLVKGDTLAAILAKRKSPEEDLPKLLGIFEQICQTMAYAHSKGVIHRDLKPANIMVGAFGEVQVMDWGLSKVLDTGGENEAEETPQVDVSVIQTKRSEGSSSGGSGSNTIGGSIMGTPAYMPPEQAHGRIKRLDASSDVFALGSVLAEILSGKPCYVADDFEELVYLAKTVKLEDCFKRLDASNSVAELLQICKKSLAEKQNERHTDASELASEITEYLEGVQERLKATELAKVEAETRTEEEQKRKRLYLSLAGVSCIALLVTAGLALTLNRQSNQLKGLNFELGKSNNKITETNLALREANSDLKESQQQTEQARQSEAREKLRLQILRVADKARQLRATNRDKSILLAIEAIQLAKSNDLWPMPDAHAALLEATIDVGGRPAPFPHKFWSTAEKNRTVMHTWEDEQILTVRSYADTGEGSEALELPIVRDPFPGHVFFNLDGTRITTYVENGTKLWSLNEQATALEKEPYVLEGAFVRALSHDASLLVGEADGQLYLWNAPFEEPSSLDTGRLIGTTRESNSKEHNSKVEISNDNRWLVQHSGNLVELWRLDSEDVVGSIQTITLDNARPTVGFSPNSRWLLVGGQEANSDFLLDLHSDSPVESKMRLEGAAGAWLWHSIFAFSADSKWLFLRDSAPDGGLLYRLDGDEPVVQCLLKSPEVETAGGDFFAGAAGFSPDGRLLVTAEGFALRLWDLAAIDKVEMQTSPLLGVDGQFRSVPLWQASYSGEQHTRLLIGAMDNHVDGIRFSSDSRWVHALVGTWGRTTWDLHDPLPKKTQLEVPESPRIAKFSPLKNHLAIGKMNGTAEIYRLVNGIPTGEPTRLDCEHESPVMVEYSPDGNFLATYSNDWSAPRIVQVWDAADLKEPIHRLSGLPRPIYEIRLSPNGRFLLADLYPQKTKAPEFYCWDLETGSEDIPKVLNGHSAPLWLYEFGADDFEVFSGGFDGTVVRWDLEQEEPTHAVILDTEEVVWSITQMPHGWRVASGQGEEGHLWDLDKNFQLLAKLPYKTATSRYGIQKLSSDGRWVGDLAVWDSEKKLAPIAHVHGQAVLNVAFSPGNDFYASVSGAGFDPIVVSYLPTGGTMRIDGQLGRPRGIHFSPDGRWLATPTGDWGLQGVRLWEMDVDSAVQRGKRLVGRELTDKERIEFGVPSISKE